MLRVKVWGENVHDLSHPVVKAIYPTGMHQCIADFLNKADGIQATTATLQEPEHGLTQEVLDNTDVLTWWGHCAHGKVEDAIVERVQKRVLEGMGLLVLHSGHHSKLFKRLMGTTCNLSWRVADEKERVWNCQPSHPITQGIDAQFELEQSEMYGEPFGIPTPDEQIFISWYEGGEVFRSGVTYKRGNGKIFYFSPGHETYPIYHNPNIQKIITNGVRWAKPEGPRWIDQCHHTKIENACEKIASKAPLTPIS